jgi:hypothetical protein
MMNVIIAPDNLRRANGHAVSRRSRWRSRYASVSTAIRRAKSRLQVAHRMGHPELERGELEVLRALRVQADLLMLTRHDITLELRETAYAWAPREALA